MISKKHFIMTVCFFKFFFFPALSHPLKLSLESFIFVIESDIIFLRKIYSELLCIKFKKYILTNHYEYTFFFLIFNKSRSSVSTSDFSVTEFEMYYWNSSFLIRRYKHRPIQNRHKYLYSYRETSTNKIKILLL